MRFRNYYKTNYQNNTIINLIFAFHSYLFKNSDEVSVRVLDSIFSDLKTEQEQNVFHWFLVVGWVELEKGFSSATDKEIVELFNKSIKDFPDGINESLSLVNPVSSFEWPVMGFTADDEEEIDREIRELLR